MSPRRVAENKATREDSTKELENFADMLEGAVINSQENDRAVDSTVASRNFVHYCFRETT